jgi:ribose 5-phosphate isomerase B
MRITIGADHGGFELKEKLVKFLKDNGHKVKDFGTFSAVSCDYPPIGYKVAREVALKKAERGVLICKTGIGLAIVANKLPGIRAAVCHDTKSAISSRTHNDTNILVFGALFIKENWARKILEIWLKTPALGGRHKRRVKQIESMENKLRIPK